MQRKEKKRIEGGKKQKPTFRDELGLFLNLYEDLIRERESQRR